MESVNASEILSGIFSWIIPYVVFMVIWVVNLRRHSLNLNLAGAHAPVRSLWLLLVPLWQFIWLPWICRRIAAETAQLEPNADAIVFRRSAIIACLLITASMLIPASIIVATDNHATGIFLEMLRWSRYLAAYAPAALTWHFIALGRLQRTNRTVRVTSEPLSAAA